MKTPHPWLAMHIVHKLRDSLSLQLSGLYYSGISGLGAFFASKSGAFAKTGLP